MAPTKILIAGADALLAGVFQGGCGQVTKGFTGRGSRGTKALDTGPISN